MEWQTVTMLIYVCSCLSAADFANPKEAVKLLLQSASAGHVRAQYQLALCLHHGRGIARNIQEAVMCLKLISPSGLLFATLMVLAL